MQKDKQIAAAEKYVQEGKLDKALKAFQKLVESDPDDRRLKLKLGDIYMRKQDLAAALNTYQQVADGYVEDQFHLKAIAVYKRILKLNPTMIDVNERLGDIYREIGLTKDALSQYFIVADHYEQSGDFDRVLAVRRKIVEADPSATTSRIRLAELYQKEGMNDDAFREYERVAKSLKENKAGDGLTEVYERLLYYRPDQPLLLAELAKTYIRKGDAERALRRMESASAAVRADLDVMAVQAEAYLTLEQRENARQTFRKLYEATLKQRDGERAARALSRIGQAFADEPEYVAEMERLRRESGFQHAVTPPKHFEDLETTTMFQLEKSSSAAKKESTADPQTTPAARPASPLDKTEMFDLDEFERLLKQKDKK